MKIFFYTYQHFLYKKDYSEFKGEWALVTGASYGIGRSLAISIAKRGLNVYIIARSKDKLESVAKEVRKHNVEVRCLVFDLAKRESYKEIKEKLNPLPSIVINNVGGLSADKQMHEFLWYQPEDFDNQMQLNFWSSVEMCRICMPEMVQRKRGIVLNISSVASVIPYWMTPYTSAKNALNGFSHALHREYLPYGVTVHGILVGMVDTPLNANMEHSPEIVSPDALAEETLDAVGFYGHILTPSWKHDLATSILVNIPDFIRNKIIASVYKNLKSKMTDKKMT
jgi:17beta-estradiol 17-dehydrogenase / very-long-chain 3-oxoacyl-CoA reductase